MGDWLRVSKGNYLVIDSITEGEDWTIRGRDTKTDTAGTITVEKKCRGGKGKSRVCEVQTKDYLYRMPGMFSGTYGVIRQTRLLAETGMKGDEQAVLDPEWVKTVSEGKYIMGSRPTAKKGLKQGLKEGLENLRAQAAAQTSTGTEDPWARAVADQAQEAADLAEKDYESYYTPLSVGLEYRVYNAHLNGLWAYDQKKYGEDDSKFEYVGLISNDKLWELEQAKVIFKNKPRRKKRKPPKPKKPWKKGKGKGKGAK